MYSNVGHVLVDNLKSIHVYTLDRCKYAMVKFKHILTDMFKIYF